MTPVLVVTGGPAAGLRVAVERRLVVGRRDADVTIEDPELSRRHATVEPAAGEGLVVSDLGSTNGTWVNGTRIAVATVVRPGDELALGDSRMRAESAPRPAQSTPMPVAPPPASVVAAGPPQQPFGSFAASPMPTRAPRRAAATRLPAGMVATWVIVIADALALLAYFATR